MSNTFMIIDDDINIIQMLKIIITKNDLGKVVSTLNSGKDAIDEVLFYNPDIVLIDYLMPEKDGIEVIQGLLDNAYTGKIVMISQVEDRSMISKAYTSGILFFIKKPINSIEVVNVLKNIAKNIELEKSMDLIKNAIGNVSLMTNTDQTKDNQTNVEFILSDIGIIGDLGSNDLILLIELISSKKRKNTSLQYKLQDCYDEIARNKVDNNSTPISSNAIEQRIRRIIQKSLSNIAELGLDDYYNDKFIEYSTLLFDFKQVRQEMNYISGNSKDRGKINIRKFIEGAISKL